ncbi:MAG: lipoprotein-releasing system permease protein [Pseudomonadota bacterium]|jgi:lipoprotein-releasing system permease protein|nr:lipoprotein-releasing system permease protein [Pseudomonadota bacterium]MDQ1345899.1 lipoprotein-releasing system permease protein [Pseudomonadota bacterium]
MSGTPYELRIGRRYLRSTGNRFLSFISLMSMVGVAIGVAVLIVVLSVMNGFERELRERILSMTSHATVTTFGAGLQDWPALRERALANPAIEAVAPYVEGEALLIGERSDGVSAAVALRGIDPVHEAQVSAIGERLRSGSLAALEPGSFRVLLGAEVAARLGVAAGDTVVAAIAQGTVTPAGVVPRMRRFTVAGVFYSGMYEIDNGLALVNLGDAGRLFRTGDDVTGLRLKVRDPLRAPSVAREVARGMDGGFLVEDWTQRHANFFRSIELTKRMMFFILLLVVAVAAFNIVSTLVMAVKDKQPDIAILRTLGARPGSVLAIFATQGTVIGLLGTLGGVVLGVLLSVNLERLVHGLERLLGTRFMDASVYLMSDLPAHVEAADVTLIAATAFALCCLSTLYPAWRAARTHPAKALRHD